MNEVVSCDLAMSSLSCYHRALEFFQKHYGLVSVTGQPLLPLHRVGTYSVVFPVSKSVSEGQSLLISTRTWRLLWESPEYVCVCVCVQLVGEESREL